MLATPGTLPGGPDWLFEVEWDGNAETRIWIGGIEG